MMGNFLLMFKFAGLTLRVVVVVFPPDFFMFVGIWLRNPKKVGKWLLNEIATLKKLSILVPIRFQFFTQTSWCCMKLESSLVICAHGLEVPTETSLNCHLPPFRFPLPFLFVNFRPALMYETTWSVLSYNQQLQNCSNGSIWRHLYTVMSPIFWPSFHTPAVTPAATAAPRAVTWRGKHGHLLGKHSFSTPTLW